MEELKGRKCKVCDKPLKAVGMNRKNGKGFYSDWKDRSTHLKCYKEYLRIKTNEEHEQYMKEVNELKNKIENVSK
jgi:chromosome segregation and condensation protein ScpB